MSRELSGELHAMLGDEGFAALTQAFGGTRLLVPRRLDEDHEIAKAIGIALAKRLSRRYAPDQLRVPLAREHRALHYRGQGLSNAEIARRLGITETGVDKLFRRRPDAPAKGSQLSLF